MRRHTQFNFEHIASIFFRNHFGSNSAKLLVIMSMYPECSPLLTSGPKLGLPRNLQDVLVRFQENKTYLEAWIDSGSGNKKALKTKLSFCVDTLESIETIRENLRMANEVLLMFCKLSATSRCLQEQVAIYFERCFLPMCIREGNKSVRAEMPLLCNVLRLQLCSSEAVVVDAEHIDDSVAEEVNCHAGEIGIHELAWALKKIERTSLSVRKKKMFIEQEMVRMMHIGATKIEHICDSLGQEPSVPDGSTFGCEMDEFAKYVLGNILTAGNSEEREYYFVLATTTLLHLALSEEYFLHHLVGSDVVASFVTTKRLLSNVDSSVFSSGLPRPDNFARVAQPLVSIMDRVSGLLPRELPARSTMLSCLCNELEGWLQQKAEQEEEVQVESLSI